MSATDWYYTHEGQQNGPLSPADLKMLAVVGQLLPEDLVWRDGMNEWIPAGKVRGLFDSESIARPAPSVPAVAVTTPATFEPSPVVYQRLREERSRHFCDGLLDLARAWFSPSLVRSAALLFSACGHYGLYLAMLLVAILGVTLSLMSRSVGDAATGLAAAATLGVLQYTAWRLRGTLERLHRTMPVRMTSSALPDCFALLQALIGLAVLVGLTLRAAQSSSISLVLPGVAGFIVCWYAAMVALNLQTLHAVSTAEASLSEEALGVLAFLMQVVARLTPVLFGVGVGWGILKTGVACVLLFVPVHDVKFVAALLAGEVPAAAVAQSGRVFSAQLVYGQATTILLAAAAAPLVSYLLLLVCGLGLDVLRALTALDKAEGGRGKAEE